ncbi:MAG TPA: class I SAM-dependent methyltransferase [Candidatus Aenigmarchaeota archaeon]|nr:class I SAM-dependent methyltransferase [Candidatus Aenigmarchaeota archaeon]
MKVYDKIAESWYNVRHWSIFRNELEKLNEEWEGGKLLNIGCAHGADFLPFSPEKFKFFGIDSSRELILLSKKYSRKFNLTFYNLVGDMRCLPFKDESFDYVICIATLHHLLSRKERLLALSELGRVLKREAFITVWDRANPELPNEKIIEKEWGREKLKRKYYLYDKEEFEGELRKAGFSGKVWSDGKNLLALVRR